MLWRLFSPLKKKNKTKIAVGCYTFEWWFCNPVECEKTFSPPKKTTVCSSEFIFTVWKKYVLRVRRRLCTRCLLTTSVGNTHSASQRIYKNTIPVLKSPISFYCTKTKNILHWLIKTKKKMDYGQYSVLSDTVTS